MRWMVRTGAAMLVALLVVFIPVGSETPASAVEVVPPVDPSSALTSTVVRLTQSGSGTWSVGDYLRAFAYANRPTALAVPAASSGVAVASRAVPITPMAPLTAAGSAVPLVQGFVGGFALGGAGISFVGSITGTDFDSSMCQLPEWAGVTYSVLTMGSGPSCRLPVADPNAGLVAGVIVNLGSYGQWRGATYQGQAIWCGPFSADHPGVSYQWSNAAGSWTGIAGANWANYCTSGAPPGAFYVVTSGSAHAVVGFRAVEGGKVKATGTPVSTTQDPVREGRCVITWPGGSKTDALVGQYRESQGFPVGGVNAACQEAFVSKPGAGPDLIPDQITIESTNTETGAKTEIAGQDVPDFTESERKGLNTGDGTGLRLLKVVNGVTQSCMTWEAACGGWWSQSSSGTDQSTYRCVFGGNPVALVECGIYRHTFEQPTSTPTITDPATGEDVPWTSSTDPANEYGPGGQSNQAPNQCVVSFSLNPVDWVMRPLRCLFEPRASKVEQVKARWQVAWTGSGIGALGLTLGGFVDAFNAANGCGGLPLHLEAFGHTLVDTRLLAACEEPAKGVAATVRLVLTVGILGGGLLASVRYLGAVFGFVGYGRVNNGKNSGGSGVHFE